MESSRRVSKVLERHFEVKTARDTEGDMSDFARDMVGYFDAVLYWGFYYTALNEATKSMSGWAPGARPYPVKILAGEGSALVDFVDTPEMFGHETRTFGAVDFADGKIVRFCDYADMAHFDDEAYQQLEAVPFPPAKDLGDARVQNQAHPTLNKAVTALHQGFAAADRSAAAAALHADVVLNDRALRTHVLGRIEVTRYLERVLGQVPYGHASILRHVVGGPDGGGFEWTSGPGADRVDGITALELDADGLITSITPVYNSRKIDPARKRSLVLASIPS